MKAICFFSVCEEYAHSRADADVWLGQLQGSILVCDRALRGSEGCHASILGSMVAQRCPESSLVVREHPCDEEVFDALQEDDPSLTVKDAEFEWAPAVGVGGGAQHQWCEPVRGAPASGLRSTDGMVELCCTHQIVPGESGLRSFCWYMHHH